jgi:hypothetical protein
MNDSSGCVLVRSRAARLPVATSEREALDAVLETLAPAFDDEPPVSGALLVISEDAGSATAVGFWREALAQGLGLVSPGAFPWCLANAPCGTLARRFGITGPNVTWLANLTGALDHQRRAFEAPAGWLVEYLATTAQASDPQSGQAWVVALVFGEHAPGGPRAMVWQWRSSNALTLDFATLSAARCHVRDIMVQSWQRDL